MIVEDIPKWHLQGRVLSFAEKVAEHATLRPFVRASRGGRPRFQDSESLAQLLIRLRDKPPSALRGGLAFRAGQVFESIMRLECQGGAEKFRRPDGLTEWLVIKPLRSGCSRQPTGDVGLDTVGLRASTRAITGGNELLRKRPNQLVFVGSVNALEGDSIIGAKPHRPEPPGQPLPKMERGALPGEGRGFSVLAQAGGAIAQVLIRMNGVDQGLFPQTR